MNPQVSLLLHRLCRHVAGVVHDLLAGMRGVLYDTCIWYSVNVMIFLKKIST